MHISSILRISAFGLLLAGSTSFASTVKSLSTGSAIRLDLGKASQTMFLVYPGLNSGSCGIRLVQTSGHLSAESTSIGITVKADGQVVSANSDFKGLAYQLSEEVIAQQLYGVYVTIETLHGEPLKSVFREAGDVIVVTAPCP